MKGVKKMQKNNLTFGIFSTIAGIILLIAISIIETKLYGLLFSFSFAITMSGIFMVGKYLYWSRPSKIKELEERLDAEQINLHDERKEALRNKSGRYAYIIGLIIISISIIVFSVMSELDIPLDARFIVLYLSVYLVFQYAIGIIIFRKLNRKY